MLPGMLKGERVASLSEAHVHENPRKIRERSAKDRRKVRERSRRPSKPPALQAMGYDIAFAIRCWSLGLRQVPTSLDLPGMLCGLTGPVWELTAWAKSSFRVQGLVFASNIFRESSRWCARQELWISAKRSFCYEGNFGQRPYIYICI